MLFGQGGASHLPSFEHAEGKWVCNRRAQDQMHKGCSICRKATCFTRADPHWSPNGACLTEEGLNLVGIFRQLILKLKRSHSAALLYRFNFHSSPVTMLRVPKGNMETGLLHCFSWETWVAPMTSPNQDYTTSAGVSCSCEHVWRRIGMFLKHCPDTCPGGTRIDPR